MTGRSKFACAALALTGGVMLLAGAAFAQQKPVSRAGVTLAAGQTEPDPIQMTLGYYVRGDRDCDQVWPGDGDLAWMTPTAFIIDFGGCEPGQFLQTGPNSWREEQRCLSELGDDAGAYNVTYEVIGADLIKREASLDVGDAETETNWVEVDDWKYCPAEDVSDNARFQS
ncbi:hypothetical protein [Brevundimonas sp.]|uniref:hypothetical protein n=1 Tax=Brevundimonas sp. TaxID=1871086 RepID=UPI003BA9ED83